ncbi:uncharacterized protein LOC132938935 [Metopolophium dirhodum]|uniref:uncharacterized protein LOC132938935 n=1 Tax=Metopolophium dirhodum TaxID=44670 RepID=UPI00298F68CF|nr:uncharacterized protein LOC132938935 [Metopolophium dirhodum]
MTDATTVLDELVKAKESIKRKYIALKTGSDNVQQLMTQTLKPIIDPLTKISNKPRLNKENINVSSKNSFADDYQQEIENWLQSTDLDKIYGPKKLPNGHIILGDKEMSKREIANELHKPARKNFTRRRVNVYGKNDLWQADLVEMIPYSKVNGGYKYILVVIDCFTKFSWAKPLKSKTGKEVTSAMATILVERSPKLLQLDNGKEFYNTTFDALMSKYGIHKYSTFSILKASIAERMNRTLKGRMYKEFTARGSREWVSILPKLLDEYNNSPHRTIGMTPIQADSDPASVVIKQRKINNEKIKFKVGDKVRISTQKGVFTKGYLPNWSTEIFEIIKINKTLPATYQLQDYMSNPIAGCFYSSEISKTDFPNEYLIEKIIRKKGDQMYVKWLGFDNIHNSWINTRDVKK